MCVTAYKMLAYVINQKLNLILCSLGWSGDDDGKWVELLGYFANFYV